MPLMHKNILTNQIAYQNPASFRSTLHVSIWLNLYFLSPEFVRTQCGYVQVSTMESTDFVKADSRNLPVVDPFMMVAYFNALHRSSLEVRGVKTVLAHAG